jgi:hypothetical protein
MSSRGLSEMPPIPKRRWSFTLLGLFWTTTVLAMFFAAWTYLPVASNYRRFGYSWSIVFLAIAAIGLGVRARNCLYRPPPAAPHG